MESIPDNWEPRHIAALKAWEQGDLDRLCKLCNREISAEAFKVSSSPLADFDELCQRGRDAVWECSERYEPATGVPFQAFAQKRIRYAMKDMLRQQQRNPEKFDSPAMT